jgi:hypothetical protein
MHMNYSTICNVAFDVIMCKVELGDKLVRILMELLKYMHSYVKRL